MKPFALRLASLIVSLTMCSTLVAAPQTTQQHIAEFALARIHEGRQLIQGPGPRSEVAAATELSCAQLYERRIRLQGALNDYKSSYWDDPRNQAAVFLGSLWSPAFYFLGYTAITAHLDELSDGSPQAQIDMLRRVSATQRCFEK